MSRAERDSGPAAVFAALGDPTRLAIVRRLNDGDSQSIGALTAATDLTRQAVTKHLHVLENAGIVARRRAGRESLYLLRPEGLDEARRYLDMVSEQWDEALLRLKRLAEG